MSDNTSYQTRGFKIRDRRFWVRQPEDESADETSGSTGKPTYVAQLEAKLAQQEQLLSEYAELHKQSRDELDGIRGRIGREMSKENERDRRKVIIEFLDILDNLDRALESAKSGDDVGSVVHGVTMIRDMVITKLERFGVRRMKALGQGFNPAKHEALTVVPSDDPAQNGCIVEVIREGYCIDEETLRPASVAVARHS